MDESTKKKSLAELKLDYLKFLKRKLQEKLERQKKHTILYSPKEEIVITGEDIEKIREWRRGERGKKILEERKKVLWECFRILMSNTGDKNKKI